MTANADYFIDTGTYLKARGFDPNTGDKTGGIIGPKQIQIDSGAVLFRLFHLSGREFGEWWSTAYELARIFSYFGRKGLSAATGRSSGNGILHATLAVRHDWSLTNKGDPNEKPVSDHLGRFLCVTSLAPMSAYYGPGDDAPSADKKTIQKAALILTEGGAQVRARQLYFPDCWAYRDKFSILATGSTDTGLISAINKHNPGRLAFE